MSDKPAQYIVDAAWFDQALAYLMEGKCRDTIGMVMAIQTAVRPYTPPPAPAAPAEPATPPAP